MRSSKSRSRSKSNRPRTLGNITNRVFDSSGPEGKVRGTPQQIIDKYNQLSRDAQLSNDRVNAENFLQHAEHYTRMLGEAMREMQAEQEQRRQYDNSGNQNNNQNGRDYSGRDRGDGQQPDLREDRPENNRDINRENGRENSNRDDNGREDRTNGQGDNRRDNNRNDNRNNDRRNRQLPRNGDNNSRDVPVDVIDPKAGEDENGLVETPEASRPRQHRQPRAKRGPEPHDATQSTSGEAAKAPVQDSLILDTPLNEPQAEKPRKPRAPRKKPAPKAESTPDLPSGTGNEAAE